MNNNSSINTYTYVNDSKTFRDELDVYTKYTMITLYGVIGCVSFVLNSLIFLIVAVNKKLWTNSYYLLVSLAVTDWLIIVVGIPIHILNILKGESIMGEQWCAVYGFFISLPFQSSIYHLAIIAYHRYILTIRRKSYNKYFGKRKIPISFCMAWLIPMVLCSMPFFGWGKYYYDETRMHCMLNWTYSLSFMIFTEITVFPSNVVIMIYCYFKLITTARRRLKSHTDDRKKAKRRKLELHSTYMMLVVVLTCVVCFTPYCISIFYEFLSSQKLSKTYGMLSMAFAYSNSMFDFIIYSAMNKRFRRCCLKLFSVCCQRNNRRQNFVAPDEGVLQPAAGQSSTNRIMQTVNITKSTTYSGIAATSSAKQPPSELFLVNKSVQRQSHSTNENNVVEIV